MRGLVPVDFAMVFLHNVSCSGWRLADFQTFLTLRAASGMVGSKDKYVHGRIKRPQLPYNSNRSNSNRSSRSNRTVVLAMVMSSEEAAAEWSATKSTELLTHLMER